MNYNRYLIIHCKDDKCLRTSTNDLEEAKAIVERLRKEGITDIEVLDLKDNDVTAAVVLYSSELAKS